MISNKKKIKRPQGGEEEGENVAAKQKAELSLALGFVTCETVHRLSSKLWKLIENIYIRMTGGRGSLSSVWGYVMLGKKEKRAG